MQIVNCARANLQQHSPRGPTQSWRIRADAIEGILKRFDQG
jgi:hypothetical protein